MKKSFIIGKKRHDYIRQKEEKTMREYCPDYRNIVKTARNVEVDRFPLYDHSVALDKIGEITGEDVESLAQGDERDLHEFFRIYCKFFKDMGYDAVPYSRRYTHALVGGGSLMDSRVAPTIRDMADFQAYPWEEIADRFFEKHEKYYRILREELPPGMKALGGVGNGVFEVVQDLVSIQELCYISADDEELYHGLFAKAGEVQLKIWQRLMKEYGDVYCVMRISDDLGFYANTTLPTNDVKTLILPELKKVVDLVHSYNKPFLFHSCGNLVHIMDDLIDVVKIDAKHSNEDKIAPFYWWVEKYGDRIGNFGGVDVDVVCTYSKQELKEYLDEVIRKSLHHGGVAFGTGNSVPGYVPMEKYLNMNEIIRGFRRE